MPWIRLDEEFTRHPKVAQAGPLAIAMQVAGLCYCNQNLTDGFIPRGIARTLLAWEIERANGEVLTVAVTSGMTGDDVDCGFVIELLLEHGIWERAAGGYQIHDYHDYQPTRANVLAERAQKREAGRRGGLASAKAKQAGAKPPAQAPATANGQAGAQAERQAESKPVPVPKELTHPPLPVARGDEGGWDGESENGLPHLSDVLKEIP